MVYSFNIEAIMHALVLNFWSGTAIYVFFATSHHVSNMCYLNIDDEEATLFHRARLNRLEPALLRTDPLKDSRDYHVNVFHRINLAPRLHVLTMRPFIGKESTYFFFDYALYTYAVETQAFPRSHTNQSSEYQMT
jgi:hypothetical protein